jgi:hypothetical protein
MMFLGKTANEIIQLLQIMIFLPFAMVSSKYEVPLKYLRTRNDFTSGGVWSFEGEFLHI